MQYLELKQQLKDFLIFSLSDIEKIDSGFHRRRLNNWQDKGYIKKVIKGYYIFSDLEINESVLYIIANNIYQPSYISLEMALSYYGLIPESVYEITSCSSKRTYAFNTKIANFSYRKIRPELMFGYQLVSYQNHNFKIVEIEKAILDYFYVNPRIKTEEEFAELRINKETFQEKVNIEKFKQYLKQFNNKTLEKRVNKFLKYINA